MVKGGVEFLTYEELKKRDPVIYFSHQLNLPEYYINELYYICENDWRFHGENTKKRKKYIKYGSISDYIRRFWNVELKPRKIKYIHLVIKNYHELLVDLKRMKTIKGTYRDLVLRKA